MITINEIKKLLDPVVDTQPEDDFRILDSWTEYDGEEGKKRKLRHLCYKIEVMDPVSGKTRKLYKAVRFVRVRRIPKSAKQSTSLMDMQQQVLTGCYERRYNMVTVIANIIHPTPVGLLYLYGVQGIATDIDEAKKRADRDFHGLIGMLQGTYRVLHIESLTAQQGEWLLQKMFHMDYISVVRGIPKAKTTGEDIGNKGAGGANLNPDSEGTIEEFVAAMAEHEYIVQILSSPVYTRTLEQWSKYTQQEMTIWQGQMQGSKSVSFNLSIPFMCAASAGQSQGWSKNYTQSRSRTYSTGESYTTGYSQNSGRSISQSLGESFGLSQGTSKTQSSGTSYSVSNGQTIGQTKGVSQGYSQGESTGQTIGLTQGRTIGQSQGVTVGRTSGITNGVSSSNSLSYSIGNSKGQSLGTSIGQSQNINMSQSAGTSSSRSYGQGINQSQSYSEGQSTNMSQGYGRSSTQSYNQSHTDSSSLSHALGSSHNVSNSHGNTWGLGSSAAVSESASKSRSNSLGYGESASGSQSYSGSNGVSNSQSTGNTNTQSSGSNLGGNVRVGGSHIGVGANYGVNDSSSDSISNSSNHGNSASYSSGGGYTQGGSASAGAGSSVSSSNSVSNSASVSLGGNASTSEGFGKSETYSASQGSSYSQGYGASYGETNNISIGNGVSQNRGTSIGQSQNLSMSSGTTTGASYGVGAGQSTGQNVGQNTGVSYSISGGSSSGRSASSSNSVSVSNSQTVSESNSLSNSISQSKGSSYSNSVTQSLSNSQSLSSSESSGQSQSTSLGESQGQSYSQSETNGTGQSWSEGNSVSNGRTSSEGSGESSGISSGISGGMSRALSGSMGIAPSIGFNRSYQWVDQQVKDIVELLEFQNERLKKALRGEGMFYTCTYIACPDMDALSAAMAAAKSTWQNEYALCDPLTVLDLGEVEQAHLLGHFSAFSIDITRERVAGVEQYKYETLLLPGEYVAYTHLPRISEGGIDADVNDIPKFRVPSMLRGDIYIGTVLSAERYTFENGYRTPFDYRMDINELMHSLLTGGSRSGKTVLGIRFAVGLAHQRREKTGKRLRILCMDPKQDWRAMCRFVEPERFHFYSLGNPYFHPIDLNPCRVPKGVIPQHWVDNLVNIFCRSYGLLERGKQMMSSVFYSLYEEAGVFDVNLEEAGWEEKVSTLSSQVTFAKAYRRMEAEKVALEDPSNKIGKAGNDTRDAYARLLDRLSCFSRTYSIERKLFSHTDRDNEKPAKDGTCPVGVGTGIGIDELLGNDDVTILESYGLESTFSSLIFGLVLSGIYMTGKAKEGGFLSPDQYETVMIIEEANKVLTGSDVAGTKGGSMPTLSGQSIFEEIMDQAAGLGMFVVAITQKISMMPSSVIANCGMLFVCKLTQPEDVNLGIRMLGREERYEDRDLVKFLPKMPVGWSIIRSSRGYDFIDAEPVLVQVRMLNRSNVQNRELDDYLARGEWIRIRKRFDNRNAA